ncbi:Testis Expressed Sequence [Dictyocoela muelleri]|nr:Testis Expressed Sequence [Dictyocoela muelleri]
MILIFVKSILAIILIFGILLGLSISLYYSIRYIEEHTFAAKNKIDKIIKSIMILHLLPLIRGIGIPIVLFSLLVQLLFYNLLDLYPDIKPSNLQFLFGGFLALVNHFWFLKSAIEKNLYTLEVVFYFVFIVWVTPFCFFMSLSANEDTLPQQGKKRETWVGKFVKNLFIGFSKSE